MLTDERFDRGAAVHICDGDDPLIAADFFELRPALFGLFEVRHVRHRAAGAKVRQDHADFGGREDVGRFRHEVHAAEDDVRHAALVGRLAAQLKAVAGEIGEVDHRVLLVVMPENRQA